jgi:uncharacterized RDD family membrane protein YckC
MNASSRFFVITAALACMFTTSASATAPDAHAGAAQSSTAPAPPGSVNSPAQDTGAEQQSSADNHDHVFMWKHDHHGDGQNKANIGHDSYLAKDQHADALVSIFGSSTSDGDVSDAVVSIFGNTRVTGPVGDAAVAIFGNTYVDSKIGDAAVAVFGNVELGPNAEVGGDVVSIGGTVTQDPAAVVHGNIQSVFGGMTGDFSHLQTWFRHCLLLGRPLALVPGLGWAWTIALVMLALYVLLGLVLHEAVDKCVHTLQTRPGQSILASLLLLLAIPILFVLLCITVIGVIAVPFVAIALFLAKLFGRAVILAWIGGSLLRGVSMGQAPKAALSVLVGGIIVLALYCVPFLGFIVFTTIGLLGLGVVIYTLILNIRDAREARRPPAAPMAGPPPVAAPSPASPGAEPATAVPTSEPAAVAAAPSAAANAPRAGFWIRMGALFLDALLIGIVVNFLHVLHGTHDLMLIVLAIYGAVMWKIKGTTVGGILCNLHVVRLDGRPIDWGTAIVRALSCFLSLVVLGLGFIWIAFDSEKQAWHDKIAGTVVVRSPRGASLV